MVKTKNFKKVTPLKKAIWYNYFKILRNLTLKKKKMLIVIRCGMHGFSTETVNEIYSVCILETDALDEDGMNSFSYYIEQKYLKKYNPTE